MRFGWRSKTARLRAAVLVQDAQLVAELVASGIEVDRPDKSLRTPLHYAASRADLQTCRILLTAGADPNTSSEDSETPYYHALTSMDGVPELSALFIEFGADPRLLVDINRLDEFDRTALHYAAFYAHLPLQDLLITTLLEAGSQLEARDCNGFTLLHAAAGQDQARPLRRLLEAGAEVDVANNVGDTPLIHAAKHSRAADEVIGVLREWGADPLRKNQSGWSALSLARREDVSGGNFDRLRASLSDLFDDYDALVERLDTPLHRAAAAGDEPRVQDLLAAGGNPAAADIAGRTPVYLAAADWHREALLALLRTGVPVDIEDDRGQTPLLAAVLGSSGSPERLECVRLLVEYGANPDHTSRSIGSARGIAETNNMTDALVIFASAAYSVRDGGAD